MPSSKTTLDLESWGNFLAQERSNDYEYNILLYKFRAFFNEVRDYQEQHTNCSITRANDTEHKEDQAYYGKTTVENNDVSISSSLPPIDIKKHNITCSTNQNTAQHSNNDKKQIFQRTTTAPLYPQNGNEASRVRELILKQSSFNTSLSPASSQYSYDVNNSQRQHYNSSYNLASATNKSTNNVRLVKPQIKQRNQVSQSNRILMSKSSERLDSINNNHLSAVSNLLNSESPNFTPDKFSVPIARDSRFLQNDANIYDAVSPDDLPEGEKLSISNVAASIQNLNRLSFLQRGKLESSKSSLGIGTNNKITPNSSNKLNISNVTNSSNGNHNNEKSNNSFGSSLLMDNSNNHSSSSLSLLASMPYKDIQKDPASLYSNYVNIDFFLKRGNSPASIDGLDGDTTNEDNSSDGESDDGEDTTQMSQSLSSDHICDDHLKEMSTSALDKRADREKNSSSPSITPASSGDFLDEHRTSSMSYMTHPSPNHKVSTTKLSSFFSNIRDSDNSNISKSSTSPRDSSIKNTLAAIHENQPNLEQLEQASTISPVDNDGNALAEAQSTMRSFLSDLNLSPIDDVFEDKAQRRIVKESFAVEFCGRRKLRHLFLFNDVIVCAKYQASSKQKFTFDVRWYLNLSGVSVLDLNDANNLVKYDKEAMENQILGIRTRLMLLRGQMQHIKRIKHKQPSKIIKKLKKKRTELEAELVLLLPHLPLVIKHVSSKKYTFFLSSNFDRNQWIESIKFLQSQLPSSKSSSTSPSSSELQAWIQTCRKNLNPSLGTFLLRSNCDDDLLYGDLYINLNSIKGITKGNYYFCFEVDSYGHFSQKASSTILQIDTPEHTLNEEYVFPLDGAHTLRILLYEDLGAAAKPLVIGKAHIELSRSWFLDKPVERVILFNSNCLLTTHLSYSSSELLSSRVPHAKLCPTFGMDITQVCKKEKTNVPLLIQLCVNEVERRGMREVGIYRMSGTSTDIQRLKKAFETNPYVAEILLRDIDINSVTGFLKTYLREMPEGLFSNKLYLKFVAAFDIPQSAYLERTKMMLELFHKIPITNQHTIVYLVEHLVKVNKFENYNKMSLTNLATVLGPNILRSPTDSTASNTSDPFTAIVIGSMSQAGILYFFLNRKYSNLPLTELDPSELTHL